MVPSEWSLLEIWLQLLEAYFFSPSCKIILRFSFSEQLKKYYVLARELGAPASNPRVAESLSASSLSGLGLDFSFFQATVSPCCF